MEDITEDHCEKDLAGINSWRAAMEIFMIPSQ